MNKRKIIVSDYDQTFYIDDNDIENNKISVNKFMSDGNIFVIATGGSYKSFNEVLDLYNINYNYLILNHGLIILDNKNNILLNVYINKKIIQNLLKDLEIDKSIRHFYYKIRYFF